MNEEDRKLQLAMGAHMKQLIGQWLASYTVIVFSTQHIFAHLAHSQVVKL